MKKIFVLSGVLLLALMSVRLYAQPPGVEMVFASQDTVSPVTRCAFSSWQRTRLATS